MLGFCYPLFFLFHIIWRSQANISGSPSRTGRQLYIYYLSAIGNRCLNGVAQAMRFDLVRVTFHVGEQLPIGKIFPV